MLRKARLKKKTNFIYNFIANVCHIMCRFYDTCRETPGTTHFYCGRNLILKNFDAVLLWDLVMMYDELLRKIDVK